MNFVPVFFFVQVLSISKVRLIEEKKKNGIVVVNVIDVVIVILNPTLSHSLSAPLTPPPFDGDQIFVSNICIFPAKSFKHTYKRINIPISNSSRRTHAHQCCSDFRDPKHGFYFGLFTYSINFVGFFSFFFLSLPFSISFSSIYVG